MSYTARITYDADNTIDFKIRPSGDMVTHRQERTINRAGSGLPEFVSMYGDTMIEVDAFFNDTVCNQLTTFFWSWARYGNYFSFAVDNANIVSTTLDDAAAAGQKVIPLTATTGLAADDICLLIDINSGKREVVSIDSISAGVSVTVDSNLNFAFAADDIFRHLNFFPYVYFDDDSFTPRRTGVVDTTSALYWSYKFKFVEVFSAGYFDADDGILEL
jgi:hypothetical protein